MRSNTSDLPGTWSATWRSLRFAYRAEPRLLLVSLALNIGSWIPDALGALWLKFLSEGVTQGRSTLVAVAAAGLAASGAASWTLRVAGERIHFLFREKLVIAIEAHVARLQGEVVTIEHHERPELLDRLQVLKDHAFRLDHVYGAMFATAGSIARVAITVALLVSVHPALAVLAAFAVPTVLTSSWRARVERESEEHAAPFSRLAKHLFDLGTMAGSAKETRVTGTGALLVERRRRAWDGWFAIVGRAQWRSGLWHAAAWTLFGAAYVGAIVFTASVIGGSAGDVLLVLAAGANLSRYLALAAGQAGFMTWCLDACKRLCWLEDYASARIEHATGVAPERIERAIRLEGVSFAYPGTEKLVLRDVDLTLPVGSVVAVVGENGAGKTTLVKLLCKFYEPTSGRILIDDADLSTIASLDWRSRTAGAFQDFMRYEFHAKTAIGLGELPRIDDLAALETAVERGGASDVVARLPQGLETQLGPQWADGVELSWGQWQKLALSRGFMRDEPLLLVLDEPTAALDAETEHDLFERFAAQSRASSARGRITVLVSHRFSTVRMADLIVVLDGATVVECGSHAELIARNGLYAELYGIQARAYR